MTEAEDGQVAIEALATARPDVIILDLMMPEDGRVRIPWRASHTTGLAGHPGSVITAKDLTKRRARLNGGVERIIQKSDCGMRRL